MKFFPVVVTLAVTLAGPVLSGCGITTKDVEGTWNGDMTQRVFISGRAVEERRTINARFKSVDEEVVRWDDGSSCQMDFKQSKGGAFSLVPRSCVEPRGTVRLTSGSLSVLDDMTMEANVDGTITLDGVREEGTVSLRFTGKKM